MEAQLEGALGQAGLSLAKFGVLSKLAEAGEPLALGCLADRCSCVRSNMTQLVDRLEADKLVERVDDPNDRRSIKAALTSEGRSRYEDGVRLLDEAERGVFARLADPERDTLARLLQTLRKNA
ncbi:MAG TPA: MarR family transcriptional regulator [Thermoanaerobaculia bacterium]|nr:MarR family transcriptional regulator [Thermoanaerobaculia bacterium]